MNGVAATAISAKLAVFGPRRSGERFAEAVFPDFGDDPPHRG